MCYIRLSGEFAGVTLPSREVVPWIWKRSPDNTTTDVDDRLTCPVGGNHLLGQNALGIGWPSEPCDHLIRFESVFSIYCRTEGNELEHLDDSLADQLQGRTYDDLGVIHTSPADKHLGGIGWTTLYGHNERDAGTSPDAPNS